MTAEQIINRAYEMVGDVGNPKRNNVTDMTTFLNDAIRDLLARRPIHSLKSDGTRFTFEELESGSNADPLPLEDWLKEPLAHFVASRVFEIDAEDEFNMSQATQHLAKYLRAT